MRKKHEKIVFFKKQQKIKSNKILIIEYSHRIFCELFKTIFLFLTLSNFLIWKSYKIITNINLMQYKDYKKLNNE